MTILEKIKFEEDWLSEVNLTKENIKIAFAGIRATVLEQQPCEDCISRKDLLEKFTEECTSECACCMYVRDGYSCGLIEDAPSVTPKTDVLDKIRIEIIELRSRQNVGVLECLDIIDKYKAESEEK